MHQEDYQSSFSSYVNMIVAKFLDGKLVERAKIEEEIREEIYAELAADGIIIPPESRHKHERRRKAG